MDKTMKHAILMVIAAILMFILIKMTFSQRMVVDIPNMEDDIIEESDEDKNIYIEDFKSVSSIELLDNYIIILGKKEGDKNFIKYYYDTRINKYINSLPLEDNQHIIADIDGVGLLFLDSESIYVKKDNEDFLLCQDVFAFDKPLYQLSDNKEMIIYYDSIEKKLISYNLEINFKKIIPIKLNDEQLNHFYEWIKISPLGGYISIENKNEDIKKSFFTIYGANTGKKYVNDVYGSFVNWDRDESKVSFLFSKDMEEIQGEYFADYLGIYDISNKQIRYINCKKMISKDTFFFGDMIRVILLDDDNIINIGYFDLETNTLIGNKFNVNKSDIDLYDLYDIIKTKDKIFILNRDNKLEEKNVENIKLYNEKEVSYIKADESLITYYNDILRIENGKIQKRIEIKDDFKILFNENILVLYFNDSEIMILKLNEGV